MEVQTRDEKESNDNDNDNDTQRSPSKCQRPSLAGMSVRIMTAGQNQPKLMGLALLATRALADF